MRVKPLAQDFAFCASSFSHRETSGAHRPSVPIAIDRGKAHLICGEVFAFSRA
jgi:hypothetical protein